MATTDRRDGYTSYTAYPMSKPLDCYNYLQPASEWKEEDGALVLLVRIPSRFQLSGTYSMEINYAGVRHEQSGVKIESTNQIKVSGEYTPAGDNRTFRFNAVYGSIPDYFSSSELTVDLTLRIRIPKIITAAQIGPTESQATTSLEVASLQETRDEQKGQNNGETAKSADDRETTAGLGSGSVQPEGNKNEQHPKEKMWLQPEPVSEDVKWELKKEESSFFLLIHLLSEIPLFFLFADFQEDQVKIIPLSSSHAIQVHAERSLVRNRRRRFNRDFPVPENCDVNKMQARFQAGVFIIEVPKATTRQPCPEATNKAPIPPNLAASSSVGGEKGKPDSQEGIEEAASREPSRVRSVIIEKKPNHRMKLDP
ncbi:hypothetical protein POTOM_037065 [Populus tomentosa]|uniref:SHSP domain-containing protein n=1 Tax=Populus tomentosa TaxID=118781 RepID=A0A8X7Z3I5_POPTO|nr:hypothetical protein POTOM_037065 [Populus tomentosa]